MRRFPIPDDVPTGRENTQTMPVTLETYSDDTLRLFLSRVRTHDLTAFLRRCTPAAVERVLALLSPRTAGMLREARWEEDTPERVARAEALLQRCASGTDPCIFCAILEGAAPASFIYRDAAIAAFMDLYPVTPGHLLIIPVAHTPTLDAVEPAVAAHLMELAQRLGTALLASELGCDAFNLFLANGGAAGQDIFHVHLHVLPRFHGDGFGFRFPHYYPREADREQLNRQAARLQALLEGQAGRSEARA